MKERYDNGSYKAILSNCNISLRKNRCSTVFEPMTFVLPVQCSINSAMTTSMLGACQFAGFICL